MSMGRVWMLLRLVAVAVLCAAAISAVERRGFAQTSRWECTETAVEACAWRHGRLSSGNGAGKVIWLVGTRRKVRVDGLAPEFLDKYFDMASPHHSSIYGDFEICPLEPLKDGHMQSVCVTDARKLVVQNTANPSKVFRLLPTWPVGARGTPFPRRQN